MNQSPERRLLPQEGNDEYVDVELLDMFSAIVKEAESNHPSTNTQEFTPASVMLLEQKAQPLVASLNKIFSNIVVERKAMIGEFTEINNRDLQTGDLTQSNEYYLSRLQPSLEKLQQCEQLLQKVLDYHDAYEFLNPYMQTVYLVSLTKELEDYLPAVPNKRFAVIKQSE